VEESSVPGSSVVGMSSSHSQESGQHCPSLTGRHPNNR
jgi:hypothetical protein